MATDTPPSPSPPAAAAEVCSSGTKVDCYRHRGEAGGRLPDPRGAAVFLYDFDVKLLYGPYRTDSDGGANLVPGAFDGRFPAQVKKLSTLFQPITLLPESSPPHDVDNWPPVPAFLPPSAHSAQPPAYAHHPTTHAAPATSMASQPSPPASTFLLPRKWPHSLVVATKDDVHTGASSSTITVSLAGFIFMCSSATRPECYRHRVLGLPPGSLEAVSRIQRGAAVFLYDFNAKHLCGPYHADSDGW
ncbi:hypothetical protein SETIT_8G137800v2 [Setaria italica]|uniref:DCD domain-containing protein n=1 Tax=Setaria italica TaxID=4555 RepID=K3ZJN4_SETIT|nr:hypothetical protein SETIT_8G137800v2 [Setaria italica]